MAVALAEMFASRGKKVLLVDGDLRKQKDAQLLGCGDGFGLQDIFREGRKPEVKIRRLKKQKFWLLGSTRRISSGLQAF